MHSTDASVSSYVGSRTSAVVLSLHQLIMDHGGKSEDEAKEYVAAMKKAKRYQRDVY